MSELKQKYLEHHSDLLDHYTEGDYRRSQFLVFKEDFRATLPPKTGNGIDEVTVELIDTEDGGKIYRMGWWLNYEGSPCTHVLNKEFEEVPAFTLHQYIYGSKLCQCNKKMGAEQAGAIVPNDECEGDRFQIKSITFDCASELILYSEILDQDELEAELQKEN